MSGGVVDMLNFIDSRIFINPFENAMEITVRNKIWHICFKVSCTFICLFAFLSDFSLLNRFLKV